MATEAEDKIQYLDGGYSFAERRHSEESSHITTIQTLEVDEHIPYNLRKSSNRGIRISCGDGGAPLRRFNSSDFESRKRVEEVNGRCVMERAILIDGNIDVILKYLQHKAASDHIYNVCSHMPPHRNVLRILGILHEYNREAVVSVYQEGDVRDWVKKQDYDQQQYSKVSIQMGEGLNHLHQYDIIHRDVAIRNFLINLSEGINVKICDFEMGRLLTDSKMYVFDRFKEKLPWQNSPVEALLFNSHTTESDVYSFGISLWELIQRGKVPFGTRNREWMTDELKTYFSAAQILDMDGISPKMKLLIECCTIRLKEKRPKMSDVVKYLKAGGIEEFQLENSPKYFKKVIQRKRMYNNQGEIRYGDLDIMEDISNLPLLEPMEHVNPTSDFVEANHSVFRGVAQPRDDVELTTFFTNLINPKKAVQRAEVEKYVKMCDYLGMYYESELQEYLVDATVDELKSDFFFLKVFPSRRIAKHIIKHDVQMRESISKKIKEVTTFLNQNPKKFQELNVRLNNYFPESDAGKSVLASNIRGEASNAGISIRVGGLKKGSIIAKLFMTSDNLKQFRKQFEDDKSILRTHGTFFPTAELIGAGIFRDESVIAPEIDEFTFLGFLSSHEQLYCATLLFKYGIYNDSDLIEFLSDVNVEEELKLMEFPDTCGLIINHWMENQNATTLVAGSTRRPEQKMLNVELIPETTTTEIPTHLYSDFVDRPDPNFEMVPNPHGSHSLIDLGNDELKSQFRGISDPTRPKHSSSSEIKRSQLQPEEYLKILFQRLTIDQKYVGIFVSEGFKTEMDLLELEEEELREMVPTLFDRKRLKKYIDELRRAAYRSVEKFGLEICED